MGFIEYTCLFITKLLYFPKYNICINLTFVLVFNTLKKKIGILLLIVGIYMGNLRRRTVQIAPNFSFGLILRDIPNSITPQNALHLLPILVGLLVLPCACAPPPPPPPFLPPLFFPVLDRGTVTCAHDRRALQQLALNMHLNTDLT